MSANDEITADTLALWEVLTSAAIPPPWEVADGDSTHDYHEGIVVKADGEPDGPFALRTILKVNWNFPDALDNLRFVAVAREAMPILLREIRRLQAENPGSRSADLAWPGCGAVEGRHQWQGLISVRWSAMVALRVRCCVPLLARALSMAAITAGRLLCWTSAMMSWRYVRCPRSRSGSWESGCWS